MHFIVKFICIISLFYSAFASKRLTKQVALHKVHNVVQKQTPNKQSAAHIEELIERAMRNSFVDRNKTEEEDVQPVPSNTQFRTDITANNIHVSGDCSGDSMEAKGDIKVLDELETRMFQAERVRARDFYTSGIYNGGQGVILRGNMKMGAVKVGGPIRTTNTRFKGVKQWTLFAHETFQKDDKVHGWSFVQMSSCGSENLKSYYLGGHCLLNTEIKKEFKEIPTHHSVRVVGTVHLFDNWEGEHLSMKLADGKTIWSHKGTVNSKFDSPNLCGNEEYGDSLMNIKIDKVIEHSDNNLKLLFETDMEKDPCKASYGISDLSLYYK